VRLDLAPVVLDMAKAVHMGKPVSVRPDMDKLDTDKRALDRPDMARAQLVPASRRKVLAAHMARTHFIAQVARPH
jgi:hypothetical protein